MFRRYFVPHLIGICKQQLYRIALICLLIFIVCSQTVSAQQGVATRRLRYP